ncbi:uncharacterized protein K452DRAFT_361903 [Aplosporella prunicola CBS 121167]|uniref:Uncharacterized protein n=1 Tax=Aplosporella prunicola CBS 121167 TaxID=1176127 RepID=A0A6A6B1V8_9PEZI|nr:uncharacterized protein K452DRAFT_361903 [Aplosporella prunicola CBS 121167]KAF2137353.1 hypothetical protein K452DRAFT_361903 [Aplosporella prunicola CBS 121167]
MPLSKESLRHSQAKHISELEAKDEFKVFDALVHQKTLSPSDAVHTILDLTKAAIQASEQDDEALGMQLERTSACFFEAGARASPDQQEKLIAVLQELQNTTVTDPKTGEPVQYFGSIVWADLPTVGITFADELGSFDPLDATNWPEENERWELVTAFAAQLTASPAIKFDMSSSWALTAFKYAFGTQNEPSEPTDVAIRAACLWFMLAGERLWDHVRKGDLFASVEGENDVKYNLERWEGWKKDLEKLKNSEDQKTRSLVALALGTIGSVEGKNE